MPFSESSDVVDQAEERGMNIDSVNIRTQEDDNPVEGKTYSDVVVQK